MKRVINNVVLSIFLVCCIAFSYSDIVRVGLRNQSLKGTNYKTNSIDPEIPAYVIQDHAQQLKSGTKVLNPDTLVFSGGGAKGVAYAGALKYLEEKGKLANVHSFAGASAGAIFALIFYLNLPSSEVDKIINGIKWESLIDSKVPLLDIMRDPSRIKDNYNYLKIPADLAMYYGLVRGDVVEITLRNILIKYNFTKNGYITFAELKRKIQEKSMPQDLFIVAASLVNGATVIFSAKTTPNMDVVTAIRASMAIPFVFTPVMVDKNMKRIDGVSTMPYDVFVDGGTTYNYPIEYFDKYSNNVLGFILTPVDTYLHPKRKEIKSLSDYSSGVSGLLLDNVASRIMNNDFRTIGIDTGEIGTLSFDMTAEQRAKAINNAYNATKEYFEKN